jgi:hypothetical protein
MTYRLRFWYWHQEIIIPNITADELVQSLFFPNSCEMKDFIRNAELKGQGGPFPIEVTFYDINHIHIYHLKRDDLESIDTLFGDNGQVELDENCWILEEEET